MSPYNHLRLLRRACRQEQATPGEILEVAWRWALEEGIPARKILTMAPELAAIIGHAAGGKIEGVDRPIADLWTTPQWIFTRVRFSADWCIPSKFLFDLCRAAAATTEAGI